VPGVLPIGFCGIVADTMLLQPFIPTAAELRPYAGDVWLVITAMAVLLAPFFVRKPNTAAGTITLVGVVIALATHLLVGPADASAGRFGAMLAADGPAFLWKIILLSFVAGLTLLWFASTRHQQRQGDGPEFFLLLVCATLGLSLMGSAANLLMIFLAVELASLPSYVLAGFRKTHKPGAEAALKYVLFGAAASSVMVWGLSLLYGVCGTLNLYDSASGAGIARQIALQPEASPLLLAGLLALLVGLGFKISAAPFHFWCPDVFDGASIDVTTFLSVASKGAGLVLLVRVTTAIGQATGFVPSTVNLTLAISIGVLGVLTATIGNTAAYAQTRIKRLLAYSSIAQAGYMLCAAAMVVGPAGSQPASQGAQAILLYLAVYLFMNLGAFAVASGVERAAGGDETLAAFRGLGRRQPVAALAMAVCCFSLIGVPPLAGFTAKFNLMAVLAEQGGWWWALVAGVAVNTLLSIYVYAKVLRAMYLDEPADDTVPKRTRTNALATGIGVACAVALIALFIGSGPLTKLAQSHAAARNATPAR
jgi:NADH-quinone oxidoreductase subunit N